MPTEAVMEGIGKQLALEVARGKTLGNIQIAGAYRCAQPGCGGYLRRRKGPRGAFWSCGMCRTTDEDDQGQPRAAAGAGGARGAKGARSASGARGVKGGRGRGPRQADRRGHP